jgi:hypothetical protein
MTCAQCGYNVAAGTEVCPRCGTRAAAGNTRLVTEVPPWTPASGPGGHAAPPAGYSFDARRWTLSDKIAGGASLVVLISLFLPWFSGSISSDNTLGLTAQTGSESGTDAHGWLWLVFIISLLIVAYLVVAAGYQTLPFKSPLRHDQLLLVAASVNLLLVFIGFLLKPSTYGIAGVSIGWSIGAFLALIAAIAAVAALTPPGRQRLDSGASAAGRQHPSR